MLESQRNFGLVFPGRKGHLGDIRVCLNGACDRAGVPRVRIHALRHTFGSTMAAEGADVFSIQKAMGHKDIKTTMIYVDMSNPHIRDQVDKLNGIVIPEEKRPKSAPNAISVEKRQKKGTRKKPDSLSESSWCRRRDLNPHGFPHHPLKMACLPVPPLRPAAGKDIVSTLPSEINMESSAGGRRASGSRSANFLLNVFLPKPPASL